MATKHKMAKRDRLYARLVRGYIHLDMFRISIPIFTSDEDCRAICTLEKIERAAPDKEVCGYAGYGECLNGARLFYAMLPVGSNSNTWVHEASHLVDFVIDYLGLDPGVEGTETRAYMLGHIYSSIEEIMTPLQLAEAAPETPSNKETT